MEYTIDASNKVLGRVATEIASVLMGKHVPNFDKSKSGGDKVIVLNASKLKLGDKKLGSKMYKRFSGYPGGLKHIPMGRVLERKGAGEILRTAVTGMLPANRLRKERLARLLISE